VLVEQVKQASTPNIIGARATILTDRCIWQAVNSDQWSSKLLPDTHATGFQFNMIHVSKLEGAVNESTSQPPTIFRECDRTLSLIIKQACSYCCIRMQNTRMIRKNTLAEKECNVQWCAIEHAISATCYVITELVIVDSKFIDLCHVLHINVSNKCCFLYLFTLQLEESVPTLLVIFGKVFSRKMPEYTLLP